MISKARIFYSHGVSPPADHAFDVEQFRQGLAPKPALFGMQWELTAASLRPNVVIMVSRLDHCLNDSLLREARSPQKN